MGQRADATEYDMSIDPPERVWLHVHADADCWCSYHLEQADDPRYLTEYVQVDSLTAAQRDLAVKVLAAIENLPTVINRQGVRKGGDLNGWYSAQQGAIAELKSLFRAEGIEVERSSDGPEA